MTADILTDVDGTGAPMEHPTDRSNGHARPSTFLREGKGKNKPTDDELAARVIATLGELAYGHGTFRKYSNGVWPAIEDDEVRQTALQVAIAAKVKGIRPNSSLVDSVTKLVRVAAYVPTSKWDSDAELLACRNGVLHLPTREIRPHARGNYITSGLPFDFDPTAVAPTWDFFLQSTIPADVADFLQEFAGYCVTTSTEHETAIWLYGQPGGGKSTFLIGLQKMLGARSGLLGLREVERSRFGLSNLPGKTLIVSTEQPGDFISSAHTLNALISGELITVERKYFDPIEVMPRAKIAWAMNNLPRVPDSGIGLFRRVKVVEFAARAEGDRNPTIKERIAQEGAGILNWALLGLDRLKERGRFLVPEQVRSATEQFRANNDVVATFVSETCEREQDFKINASELYDAYKNWCNATSHKPKSATALAEDWKRLGFERYEANGRRFWRGVRLRELTDEDKAAQLLRVIANI